ncbi:MAG: hypothetical protein J4G17_10095 [Anaerolineae bacterium]|nr:hypothetical protein [Anaerolineae bacterium]
MLRLKDIAGARDRLRPWLRPTPLEHAPALGNRVWLKLESRNLTRSF